MNSLTNSSCSTFLDCPRTYYYKYERLLVPKTRPVYLVWGSYVHYMMEWTQYGKSMEEIQNDLRVEIEKSASRGIISPSEINKYEGFILLLPYVQDAYILHYKNADIKLYDTMFVERAFDINLPTTSEWRFKGKIDRAVKNVKTGRVCIWDLKTPATTGPQFWNRIPLDSQLRNYLYAMNEGFGIPCSVAIYDIIKKPSKQKSLVCNDPSDWAEIVGTQYLVDHAKYFERKTFSYDRDVILKQKDQLCAVIKMIELCRQMNYWPLHIPGNRIGTDPFFDIHVHGEQPHIMANFTIREEDDVHPELTQDDTLDNE